MSGEAGQYGYMSHILDIQEGFQESVTGYNAVIFEVPT